jgi:putative two-component system response regulator
VEAALQMIDEGAGSHFDPGLLAPFKSVLPEILQIKSQYAEENGALPDLDFTKPGALMTC